MTLVLTFLGIAAFAKEEGKFVLSAEQKTKLIADLGEHFEKYFSSALGNYSEDENPNEALNAMLAVVQAELITAQGALTTLTGSNSALEADKTALSATIASLQGKIDILSQLPILDGTKPVKPVAADDDIFNEKYLYGVIAPHMAIDERHAYNKRAYAALVGRLRGEDIPTPKQSVLDYESLKNDLGDFYRVRKQDRIQTFLLQLPSIETLFPVESGYQDRMILVNMFLDEFSQADNTSSDFDQVIKGGYHFEKEEIRMFDVMFAYKFKDLKALEKTWIGYLNREGSNTMKWSFIEFIMVETGKALHNERELRRINGRRINPTLNIPGTALGASNGLRQFIQSKIDAFQIRPFAIGEWTPTRISEYVCNATALIPPVVRNSGRIILYMSPDAFTAYTKNNEALYGLNQDYSAGGMFVKEYPNVKIKTIPNMAESKRMIWTLEGNISLFEDVKGEMYNFYFEQQDWALKVWSNWKESLWAYLVGKKWYNATEIPRDYSTQMIFCNDVDYPADYFLPMAVDDATPSVSVHSSLISSTNTADLKILGYDDAQTGQEIRIKCGNFQNATWIEKSGNFSLITADWTPVEGDVLVLRKRADGKFIEVSRLNATSGLTRLLLMILPVRIRVEILLSCGFRLAIL